MNAGESFFGQDMCQYVGCLGPGGSAGETAVQLCIQDAFRLEITEIGKGGGTLAAAVGVGAGFRVAGLVNAADPSGKDNCLSHSQGVLEAKGSIGFSVGEAVFIKRGYIVVEGRSSGEIGKLSGIDAPPGKAIFLRGLDRESQQQNCRQQKRREVFFHETPFKRGTGQERIFMSSGRRSSTYGFRY